ncbi:condensin-2 complex subunit G2 [Ambystoma mexicanum]|uniref:condensin-2 complex subunit G2 n=1 Tax=Ambystoma mexicanum TaxID=8296 RepID=UPI0037E73293
MSKREAFLQATAKESVKDFLHFLLLHKDASDPFDLNELLQELPRKQKEELWERLKYLVMTVLLENPVEGWQRIDEDSDDDMEMESCTDVKQTMAVFHGAATVVTLSVAVVDEDVSYAALMECALILHGIMQVLPKSESALELAIQHMCESWWEKELEGKEEMGKTAFIMLLKKSLTGNSTGSDVARLWHLHQALFTFDYNSRESNEVKDLLQRCFMSINYVKKEEGRRFLIFLFSWNVGFINLIHGSVKNQLQCFPKSLMASIAEIYFRAWKKASGTVLETIENNCIQDFMHHGVNLPRKSPVYPKVREILSYFHRQKLRQGVEEMLYRLYQPILWRGLKAPNSEVRSNAALLFVEAFPLRDPHINNEDMDHEIQKQFEELFSLLDDTQPLVRSTGVLGVYQITSKYWEQIPPAILTDLLKKVLGDLSSDVSSADIRCSVFKCLPILLDNKLSHPFLEQLLPSLKYNLHDNSEKVRVAFVDLLLKIKAVGAAKFWKICPMEHLLARLEVDSRSVSRRIVNLLFSSFFPVNQQDEVWCERCVTLIQMNPAAARKFYQYAYEHTASTNIAKLILSIRRCLNACIHRAKKEARGAEGQEEESEKENASVLDEVLSTHDSATLASLLEIVVILWRSIHKALEQNEEAKMYIISKFSPVLPEYFKQFKDDRCTIPLVIMASFMPASSIPAFSCGVVSKLRNMENGACESKYSTLLDCLCRWQRVGHAMELVIDWLTDAVPHNKNKNDSTRHVRIEDTRESKPDLALDYIEYMLTHTMNRDCLLSSPQKNLNQLLKAIGGIKEELVSIMRTSGTVLHSINQATALRAFSLYCRLSIHLQHKFCAEGRTYLTTLEETGIWIENDILPFLQTCESEAENSENHEISRLILKAYLMVSKDVLMVGLGDAEFQAHVLDIILGIMQTEYGSFCMPMFLSVLKEITEICLSQNIDATNEDVAALLEAVQRLFQSVLETVARKLRKQRDEALQLLHSIQEPLGDFIQTVQCWHLVCTDVHHGVLSTLLAAVVVEISYSLRKVSDIEEISPPTSCSSLPPLSSCLVTIIAKSSNVMRSFLTELMDCIASEEVEGIISLTAALYIVLASNKGKIKDACSKNITTTIFRKLKKYEEITMEDPGNLERAIYQSSMKILDDVMQP